jgi:hypothetical protein
MDLPRDFDMDVFQRDLLLQRFAVSRRTNFVCARPVRVRSQKSIRASASASPVILGRGMDFQVVMRKCWDVASRLRPYISISLYQIGESLFVGYGMMPCFFNSPASVGGFMSGRTFNVSKTTSTTR